MSNESLNTLIAEALIQFQYGLNAHQQGQLTVAENYYMQALQLDPHQFEALHMSGVLSYQNGDLDRSVILIEAALAINPKDSTAQSNYGNTLLALQRQNEALAAYENALTIDPQDADGHFNRGNTLHTLERFEEAINAYDRALLINPKDADSYYNRANTLRCLQRYEDALKNYAQSIQIRPDYAPAAMNHGITLVDLKRPIEAIESFKLVLLIEPDHMGALAKLALIYQQLNFFIKSAEYQKKLVTKNPLRTDFLNDYGWTLHNLKDYDNAISYFNKALTIDPKYLSAHYNLGNSLRELKQFHRALEHYNIAYDLHSQSYEIIINRGNTLHDLERYAEALSDFDQAISLKQNCSDAFYNRGNTLRMLNRREEAIKSYDSAVTIDPNYVAALSNRGIALNELLRLNDSIASYLTALRIDPSHTDSHWNLSIALLLKGEYLHAWPHYEWRWQLPNFSSPRRGFKQILWLGTKSLQNKKILLHSEQGFGDSIQFCRYVKLVQQFGATVILEIEKPLFRLLENLDYIDQIITKGEILPDFDYHTPLMSLPFAFHTTLNNIPNSTQENASYLSSESVLRHQWKVTLNEKIMPRIGLVWSGRSTHSNDHNRSLQLADLIAHLPQGYDYISLQKEIRPADAQSLSQNPQIRHFGDQIHDFADTAALCELMDLVISVDTSVAHLAGALGKPVWILLPYCPDWRWLLERTDSPWYPTATLFRATQAGDWHSALIALQLAIVREFPPGARL